MLQNYLKIALRQLRKQKMYAAIKVGGLALGITTCLLIALYIRNELSYDSHYANVDRLYRVIAVYNNNGKTGRGTAFAPPFAKAIKAEFPQIQASGRLMPYALFSPAGSNQLRPEGKTENTYEEGFSFADPSMLDILSIPMVYGDHHALDEPRSVVISKSKSDKYFPGQNPIGKLIYLNNDLQRPRTIGGVMADMPPTAHLHYDYLLSLVDNNFWDNESTTWRAQNYNTYIRLSPGTDPVQLAANFSVIKSKYMVPAWAASGDKNAQKFADNLNFYLQPVKDIRLRNGDIGDGLAHGDIRFVWLFGAVAVFILLLACINFINLSTARSANRAKEVGLRKVIGSPRMDLIRLFLTESLLFSALSFFLAIFLAWGLLPWFNRLSDQHMVFPWTKWWLAPIILGSALVVGLLAGMYPSLYLSGFKPIRVLKGDISRGSRNSALRSVLVIFQFATSVILIIASIVVYKQMNFIMNTKLGFEKDQVVLIQGAGTLGDGKLQTLLAELRKLPTVKSLTHGDFLPITGGKRNMNTFYRDGKKDVEPGVGAQIWRVDADYLATMGMRLVQGRNFSPELASDSEAVIINQAMAKEYGVSMSQPLGQKIASGNNKPFTVIGVVEDFNFESMRENIRPLCLVLGRWSNTIAIKAATADMGKLLSSVGAVWRDLSPHQAIRYDFMDESFARMYADVRRTGTIFTSFTVLAVIIACLGLFALSAFMAEQRSREIGIRKVLGATVAQVMGLLSKDFVRLVLIAILIAAPLAWWGMHVWLQDFVYRVSITAWVVGAAAGIVVMIALVTISLQAMRAALANPIDSLRSE